MTFNKAVFKCLKNYGNFDGRASRSEYWWFFLFTHIIIFTVKIIVYSCSNIDVETQWFLGVLPVAILVTPLLAVGSRRLHDTGKSGWLQIMALIVLGGIILSILYCRKSDEGKNKYGILDD